MAGVVRRKNEKPSKSGEKFAFVTLSDPTGEFEVLFPPESLRKCRDVLEPGGSVMVKVRCKGRDGEVRFFGDDAEALDAVVANAASALRVFVSPESTVIETLKKRLRGVAPSERGGEVSIVASVPSGAEVEVKLPGRFALDAALRGALKTAPGVLYLEDA